MTRKKTKGKPSSGVENNSTTSSDSGGPISVASLSSASSDDTEHHLVEDEYIIPQIVKVVSLADHHHNQNYSNGNGNNGPGVCSSNNIVLVDHGGEADDGDHDHPPPSFVDNYTLSLPEPEQILGLSYGDEDDEEGGDCIDETELNHKFASFTLSTPCQPDDRVDYFSTVAPSSSGQRLANPTPNSRITSQRRASTTSRKGSSSSSSRREDFEGDEEEWENCCGVIPCTSIWEELRFCEARECSTPANKKCAQCKVAFYCSEDHHRIDWMRHRFSCTPYRIQFVGMGAADELPQPVLAAVACRNIPEGEVIFTEKPMLVFPIADSQSENQLCSPMSLPCILSRIQGKGSSRQSFCDAAFPACFGCAKVSPDPLSWGPDAPSRCSNCSLPLCSYNCQLLIAHQVGECDAISSSKLEPSEQSWFSCSHALYMDVEIMRALQLDKYDRSGWELLLEMKNNVRVEHYKQTPAYNLFFANMDILVPFSVKISGYNRDLIGDVHAIINSLSFRPNLNCPFKLLFNTQPQFAHDCIPNTLQYVEEEHGGDGKRMQLVTKSAAPIVKGEIITLDFTPSPYLSYQRRRQTLSDVLNIKSCMCLRCVNPSVVNDLTTEIKCCSCRMGTVCSENFPAWKDSVWSCRICQEEISFYRIYEIERECASELSHILSSNANTGLVRELQDWIRRKGNDLNPKHHLIFTAWSYCEAIVRPRIYSVRRPDPAHVYTDEEMEHFELLGRYADVILEHLDSIRQGIWIDKGIAQFHKFYSSFTLVSRSYQRQLVSSKEFVFRVLKALKILQQALQTFTVYEGYNAPSCLHLTHEATSVLSSLKEYMNHFIQLNNSDPSSHPLPSMAQVLNRAHV